MGEAPSPGVTFRLADRVVRGESSSGESSPDDYLVLDLETGRYYGVGEAGGFIWERLDGKQELAAVSKAVAEHFEIDAERAAADLLEYVARLHELGLIERVGGR